MANQLKQRVQQKRKTINKNVMQTKKKDQTKMLIDIGISVHKIEGVIVIPTLSK